MTHGRKHAFVLSVMLLMLIVVGCRESDEEAADADADATPLRLELAVEPTTGEAPLTVRLVAELAGEIDDPIRFRCPSLAWVMGNGDVLITSAQDCRSDYAPRTFEAEYSYTAAGSFDASVRLLALDVPPSSPVPVLVRGATPTPAPVAAVAGPTIVIATVGTPVAPVATLIVLGRETPRPATLRPGPTARRSPTVQTRPSSPPPPETGAATALPSRLTATLRVAMARTPTVAGRPAAASATSPLAGIGVASPRPAVTASPAIAIATVAPALTPVASVALPTTVRPATAILVATGTATVPASPSPPGATLPRVLATSTFQPVAVTPASPVPPTPSARPPLAPVMRVLPADLYYLAGEGPRLWRLPASGEAPEIVAGESEPIDEFAVSPAGLVAYLSGGILRLVVPGVEPVTVAEFGAEAPVWSRDGRQLAYAANGVRLYDMVGGRRTQLTTDGVPVAWSRDGTWLLARGENDVPEVVHVASGARTRLPVGPAEEGGWLSDREVVWLAGPGLRLVTVRDTVLLTTILDDRVRASEVFVRPDLQLLLLVGTDAGSTAHVVDLTATTLTARPFGPPVWLAADVDFAWAPDGRHSALAGPDGVALLDPATGARVPLITAPASRPQWVLTAR